MKKDWFLEQIKDEEIKESKKKDIFLEQINQPELPEVNWSEDPQLDLKIKHKIYGK